MTPAGLPPRRRRPGLALVLGVLRPGSTSLGVVVPVVVVLTVLAVLVALVGQAVVPWALYPAL